jgi:hypothetical protein
MSVPAKSIPRSTSTINCDEAFSHSIRHQALWCAYGPDLADHRRRIFIAEPSQDAHEFNLGLIAERDKRQADFGRCKAEQTQGIFERSRIRFTNRSRALLFLKE